MKNIADMVVYDSNGQLSLIIEIKNKQGTSRQWAAQMRRNILAHGLLPKTNMFLLALPDHFYLWKDIDAADDVTPTYDINPEPLLKPYYEKVGLSPEKMSGESFELILMSWLYEIKNMEQLSPSIPQETRRDLSESGLLKKIQEGQVATEVER